MFCDNIKHSRDGQAQPEISSPHAVKSKLINEMKYKVN